MAKFTQHPGSAESKKSTLALVRELIVPRWRSLALSFLLLGITRLSGLIPPFSTRFLIDDVISKGHRDELVPIILLILSATIVQSITSFATARLLTKMGHRLVFELRQRLQKHIGVLPLSFYESNRVGALLSRIMSDVDGIQYFVGEGTIELLGGITTTAVAIFVLIRISPSMTALLVGFVVGFAYLARQRLTKVLPIFRDRTKANAEIAGRITEESTFTRFWEAIRVA
jgi:ABC-type bacteriocin/lantibiotic exporter with double-glycine peptidase domain